MLFLMLCERYSDVNYKSFLPATHKKLNINTEYCRVKIIVEGSVEFLSKFPTTSDYHHALVLYKTPKQKLYFFFKKVMILFTISRSGNSERKTFTK